MSENRTPNSAGLSDAELAFQIDPANWRGGPYFNVRFFCHSLNFNDFETALLNDPLRISDPRFDKQNRVLLRHERWPNCIGVRFYDFQRPGRREPTIVFYPEQYRIVLGAKPFARGRGGSPGDFLEPVISLAHRIKTECDAYEALLFFEDCYPRKTPHTEIVPGVFLAEPIFEAMR